MQEKSGRQKRKEQRLSSVRVCVGLGVGVIGEEAEERGGVQL